MSENEEKKEEVKPKVLAPVAPKAPEVTLAEIYSRIEGGVKLLRPKVRDNTVKLSKAVHCLEFGLQYLAEHTKNVGGGGK